jgi:hypothetical protein
VAVWHNRVFWHYQRQLNAAEGLAQRRAMDELLQATRTISTSRSYWCMVVQAGGRLYRLAMRLGSGLLLLREQDYGARSRCDAFFLSLSLSLFLFRSLLLSLALSLSPLSLAPSLSLPLSLSLSLAPSLSLPLSLSLSLAPFLSLPLSRSLSLAPSLSLPLSCSLSLSPSLSALQSGSCH